MTNDQITREMREDQKAVLQSRDYTGILYYTRKDYMDAQLNLLKEFLLTKKIEGCRTATIKDYHDKIMKLIEWSSKD